MENILFKCKHHKYQEQDGPTQSVAKKNAFGEKCMLKIKFKIFCFGEDMPFLPVLVPEELWNHGCFENIDLVKSFRTQ